MMASSTRTTCLAGHDTPEGLYFATHNTHALCANHGTRTPQVFSNVKQPSVSLELAGSGPRKNITVCYSYMPGDIFETWCLHVLDVRSGTLARCGMPLRKQGSCWDANLIAIRPRSASLMMPVSGMVSRSIIVASLTCAHPSPALSPCGAITQKGMLGRQIACTDTDHMAAAAHPQRTDETKGP